MIEFKIEKGVPKPEARRPSARKYPWLEMEVGDSFFIPGGKQWHQGLASVASKRNAPRRFSSRTVDGGVRIWRDE